MSLRDRLRSGERMVGTVLALPGAALAELAAAPFDLVWIDLEHGALDVRDAQELTIAVQRAGCAAAVRLPSHDFERLAAVLDAGPDGVVIPGVESADEVAQMVARLRYPPAGRRGYGPRRAAAYGRAAEPEQPACLVQIETLGALADASAISAVPGVDALVAGCADLSFALGAPHELMTMEMHAALAQIGAAARAAGIAFGIAGSGPVSELAGEAVLLIDSVDMRHYARAMDDVASRIRGALTAGELEGRHA